MKSKFTPTNMVAVALAVLMASFAPAALADRLVDRQRGVDLAYP